MFEYDGYFYGDVDGNTVLSRLPPNSTAPNYINMTAPLNRTLLGLYSSKMRRLPGASNLEVHLE